MAVEMAIKRLPALPYLVAQEGGLARQGRPQHSPAGRSPFHRPLQAHLDHPQPFGDIQPSCVASVVTSQFVLTQAFKLSLTP